MPWETAAPGFPEVSTVYPSVPIVGNFGIPSDWLWTTEYLSMARLTIRNPLAVEAWKRAAKTVLDSGTFPSLKSLSDLSRLFAKAYGIPSERSLEAVSAFFRSTGLRPDSSGIRYTGASRIVVTPESVPTKPVTMRDYLGTLAGTIPAGIRVDAESVASDLSDI